MSLRMSSWSLNMTRCLAVTGVFLHFGKALFAASTAALNSSLVVSGTLETTSCVAYHREQKKSINQYYKWNNRTVTQWKHQGISDHTGFMTSIEASDWDSKKSPPIRFRTLGCHSISNHISFFAQKKRQAFADKDEKKTLEIDWRTEYNTHRRGPVTRRRCGQGREAVDTEGGGRRSPWPEGGSYNSREKEGSS